MRTMSIAVALSALLAVGCSDRDTTTVATTDERPAATTQQAANLTPEQLGELGAEIKKNPNDSQRLLSEKGLTEESFEQAIRKVSEDPQASKRYADAYKRAS
jgi:hypothetical protein